MLLDLIPSLASPRQDLPSHLRSADIPYAAIRPNAYRSVAGKLLSWQRTAPIYPASSLRSMVNLGFRGNSVYASCVNRLVKAFLQMDFSLRDPVTEVPFQDWDLRDARTPNARHLFGMIKRGGRLQLVPGVNERTLWTHFLQDYLVFGNAIWEKVRSATDDSVSEVWRLHPEHVAIVADDELGIPIAYLYRVGGEWYPIEPRNVVHWLWPDPGDDIQSLFFGTPPALSCQKAIWTDSKLVDHLKLFLDNMATPATVLESGGPVNEESAKVAKRAFMRAFGGNRLGEPAVVGKDTKVHVVGLNMKDLAIGDLVATTEGRIAMVLDVPMILLGRSGTQADPTRANYAEAKKHFWYNTVLPLADAVCEIVDVFVVRELDEGIQAFFDSSRVPILQEARLRRATSANGLFLTGMVSRGVAQNMGGVTPHGPDVFYRPDTVGAVIDRDQSQERIALPPTL